MVQTRRQGRSAKLQAYASISSSVVQSHGPEGRAVSKAHEWTCSSKQRICLGSHNRGHFLQSRGWNSGSKRVSEAGCFPGTRFYSVIYLPNN